jgi:type I restriction enzyme S subunit
MKISLLQKNIPQGWSKKTLGDVSRVTAGFGFPIKFQGKKNGEYPFAKVSDMNLFGNEKYIYKAENYLDTEDLKTVKVKTFPAGTVIFPKVGAALLTNKRRILKVEAIVDNNVMGLIPSNTTSEFLYYWMLNLDLTQHISNGTLPSINQGYIEKLEFLLPTKTEQEKIADILGKIDEDITKTQELIESTEKLKVGLMQQLFTRGFGHTKFKETTLENILSSVIDHRGLTPKKLGGDWSENGVPAISAMNIKDGKIVKPETIRFVDELLFKKWMPEGIQLGDVILTSEAPLGEAYLVKSTDKYCLSQRLFALRPNENVLVGGYLFYFLTSPKGQTRLLERATGSTAKGIRQTELLKVVINYPEKEEQRKIAEVLSAVDEKILINKKLKEKFTELKKGLMSDLLSGKVRIINHNG